MTNTKFMVRVSRSGALASRYVRRLDCIPILMTNDPKLALQMGKLTAEDAVRAVQSSRCTAELVPIAIRARVSAT
ncbi:MAG TPA: hypothetical protein VJS37_12825 [Terriglobales bacterium]|nr:hypothetical protein [Terriglobales bacterium]